MRINPTFNVSVLIRFVSGQLDNQDNPTTPPTPLEINSQPTYIVQNILRSRWRGVSFKNLVDWEEQCWVVERQTSTLEIPNNLLHDQNCKQADQLDYNKVKVSGILNYSHALNKRVHKHWRLLLLFHSKPWPVCALLNFLHFLGFCYLVNPWVVCLALIKTCLSTCF